MNSGIVKGITITSESCFFLSESIYPNRDIVMGFIQNAQVNHTTGAFSITLLNEMIFLYMVTEYTCFYKLVCIHKLYDYMHLLYVFTCVWGYICVYIYVCVCIYIHTHTKVICLSIYIYTYIFICISIDKHIHNCLDSLGHILLN